MPATRLRIFISSVQRELESVRSDLKAYLLGDPFLQKFVAEVFLFENLPASDRRADETYLQEVDRCDVYIGIFGYEYGSEDAEGVSPTEREYDRATAKHRTRLVYVWGQDDEKRVPKMRALIRKAEGDVIRRKVDSTTALTAEVYASLVDYLDRHRALRIPPFDTAAAEKVTLKDVSRTRVAWFLERAIRERGFPLAQSVPTKSLLTHLNLLDGSKPTNAAILLFGSRPQSVHRAAETKCMLVHGTEYQRPFASYQVYGGDLFEQADQAVNFVLSNIKRSIGVRHESTTAPAEYELPKDAVAEAIINALVHRDYNSNGSVEVRLLSDRLEVWNPGRLPGNLTVEDLREDHASIPANPLIADPMYLARYIEKAGTGTQTMITLCREAGLPEPDFEERTGSVVVTIWRDWLTSELLARCELNERQQKAIVYLKTSRRISNSEYQRVTGAMKKTATRDLNDLKAKGLVKQVGLRGPGLHYVLVKGDKKGTKGT